MTAPARTPVRLTVDELYLLDEVVAYYRLSEYGGGAHDDDESRGRLRSIDRRVAGGLRALGEEVDE